MFATSQSLLISHLGKISRPIGCSRIQARVKVVVLIQTASHLSTPGVLSAALFGQQKNELAYQLVFASFPT